MKDPKNNKRWKPSRRGQRCLQRQATLLQNKLQPQPRPPTPKRHPARQWGRFCGRLHWAAFTSLGILVMLLVSIESATAAVLAADSETIHLTQPAWLAPEAPAHPVSPESDSFNDCWGRARDWRNTSWINSVCKGLDSIGNWLVETGQKVQAALAAADAYENQSDNTPTQMIPPQSVLLISPSEVERFQEIAKITDPILRAAELANVFTYSPGEIEPGSYEYALLDHEQKARVFAETYGLDLNGVDILFDPGFRAGSDGQFVDAGERYGTQTLENDTIVLGPEAFRSDEALGTAIFHELLEKHRGAISHDEIWELEILWEEWYQSLQDSE